MMHIAFAQRARGFLAASLTVAIVALTATSPALAAASFSGPSIAMDRSAQEFIGRGFAPNAALSVAVKAPDGTEAHHSVVANAKGVVRFSLTPTARGRFTLRVVDSGGKVLARTALMAQQ